VLKTGRDDEFPAHFNFIALVMTPAFWIGVATMVVVTLVTYWLLSWLLSFLRKGAKSWGEVHPATN
jgi:hypothetical protein